MEQRPIGFVVNIYTKDGKTYLTVVLNYRELQKNPLMLGNSSKSVAENTTAERQAPNIWVW